MVPSDSGPPPSRPDDDLPDPRLFWRWVAKATRPVVGWICLGASALVIFIGWIGVSGEAIVAKQLPFLASGGILGIGLAVVGAYFLGTEELRKDSGRLDRLERMVEELHTVLLTRPDAPALPAVTGAEAHTSNGQGPLVVLPHGESFHRPGCAMVEGKTGAAVIAPSSVRRRRLAPCPLCEPVLVDG